MTDPVATLLAAGLGLLIGLIIIAIFTLFFRWMWNITMPQVFGTNTVTFWQAFRLLILASILFGGSKVVERVHDDVAVTDTTVSQVG